MYVLIGLGNPGIEYKANRHNVGSLFLDFFIARHPGSVFHHDKKLSADIAKVQIKNDFVLLVKPTTFMNNSGVAAFSCVSRYKLRVASQLIVVHDDLDIPFGKWKIQVGTGPKLHNGLDSIEAAVKTTDFLRVRIGVDNRQATGYVAGEAYVLSDFTPTEREALDSIFDQIYREYLVVSR